MLNIRELAKQLGVSPATVSLALNYKKGVSPALAQKIREQAFKLGYYRGIKQNKSHGRKRKGFQSSVYSVCVLQVVKHGHILGAHHQSFIDGYIMGMLKHAMCYSQAHFNVELKVATIHWDDLRRNGFVSSSPPSSGYIIIATELEGDEIETLAHTFQSPLVFIDAIYDHLPYDFIDMNNTDVIYEIILHLVAQGCKTASFVGSKQNTPNFYHREIAVEAACEHYAMDLKRRYSIDPYEDPDALEMQKLLQKNGPPQALICANDYIAYNCIKALHALNYSIPKDVAVVGFDNLPASPLFQPALSSVEIPKQEIGSLALARLLAKMKNRIFDGENLISASANMTEGAAKTYAFLDLPFQSAAKQNLSCQFILRASSNQGK